MPADVRAQMMVAATGMIMTRSLRYNTVLSEHAYYMFIEKCFLFCVFILL